MCNTNSLLPDSIVSIKFVRLIAAAAEAVIILGFVARTECVRRRLCCRAIRAVEANGAATFSKSFMINGLEVGGV